jgi:hypothetical protein
MLMASSTVPSGPKFEVLRSLALVLVMLGSVKRPTEPNLDWAIDPTRWQKGQNRKSGISRSLQ